MYLKNRMLYTQLYSLPNEVLERIIIDSIVIEVLEQRLAKSAWNEKADAVLTKLSGVYAILSNHYVQVRPKGTLQNVKRIGLVSCLTFGLPRGGGTHPL